jgi:hypothetical protein
MAGHNDTQNNGIQHTDSQYKVLYCDPQHRYNDTDHSVLLSVAFFVVLVCHSECHYAECAVMLSFILLGVIFVRITMLSDIWLSFIMLRA